MNSSQAKTILIADYLGVVSDKVEIWIKSPFNPNEKTSSFKIHTLKNVWYDHSQGVGGNILDLVMLLHNCDLSQALNTLDHNAPPPQKAILEQSHISYAAKSQMEIKKVQTLQNKALIQYIEKRAINTEVAIKYLCEVYHPTKDKKYFSLGFKNDSGNYELRNKYFKGCIGSKDITTIKGIGNKELSIFEGFLDFLSALTHFKISEFKSDVIILNSVVNKSKINDLLYSNEYSKIYLFLDNDKAGTTTKKGFYQVNSNCIDCSNIYKAHKDFNDFLQSKV